MMLNSDDKGTLKNIKNLEQIAVEIRKLKQVLELRRPLLIEFCGTPKSGKSTCINSLNIFLKRNDFKTKVLTERAGICPVEKKTHPFFNTWTLCSAIAEIIEQLSYGKDRVDIIIADRAIFDALCWFEWLNTNPPQNPHLDDKNYEALKEFIMMDMWRKHMDLIYVFKVSPEKSLEREFAYLLTRNEGSIMNSEVLGGYNRAIESTIDKYGEKFKQIRKVDTSDIGPNEVSFVVTQSILEALKKILIERIGFFPDSLANKLNFGTNRFKLIEKEILKFGDRSEVEGSRNIQPVAIALITNEERDKVLVVKKSKEKLSKDSPERDKLLLYVGGHIREEDKKNESFIETCKNALHREIQEELGESLSFKNLVPILIYTPDNEKSKKHLGVLFIITMNLEKKKFKPTPIEFVMKTGTSKSGQVLTIKDLLELNENFESWSTIILKEIFKVNPKIQKELELYYD
jgi:predicted NUDIX family phosphoesterase